MMQARMFGDDAATDPTGTGTGTADAGTTDYSTLSDVACAAIPACVAWKAAGGAAGAVGEAASSAVDESLAKAQQAATQVMAPTLAQLQRLEKTITWAAIGAIVALAAATGTIIWVAYNKKR